MINKLRERMIWISGISLFAVFLLIFIALYIFSNHQLNSTMDLLADRITSGGAFMPFDDKHPRPEDMDRFPGFFTEETPYSTRFFVVHVDDEGEFIGENLNAISTVGSDTALKYAREVLKENRLRGWLDNYRYKIIDEEQGKVVVFVDGSMNRSTTRGVLSAAILVLTGSLLIVMFMILLLSKRAVKPIAASYEKQRQFITDANHELKTPLTLILTNLGIVESELGHSEWIDDIRTEGHRMSCLIEQLTALSRLDEDNAPVLASEFSISDVCKDTVSEFTQLIDSKGLSISCDIQPELSCSGDEAAIRRLMAIFLDNAVKYCSPAGNIYFSLVLKKHIIITVENTCTTVDELELDRLFDRFYRADKARTASNSFGIGLSLAKSIVEKHHGDIKAYKAGHERIGFKATIK